MNTTEQYDVVVIGGAVIGSSVAYFLSENPDFSGSIVVIEPDPTYERASTTLSLASIRHQFSNPVNIRLSQFGTEFINDFTRLVQVEGDAPDLCFRETGYLFLATDVGMDALVKNHEVQRAEGVEVVLLSPAEIQSRFPWLNTDDLAGASLGLRGEGTFDAYSLMRGFQQRARANGVEYRKDRVVGMARSGTEIETVQLESQGTIACSTVVNCAGTHADAVARMVDLRLPIEPRIRSAFVFDSTDRIEQEMPLTIDPSGFHLRNEPPFWVVGTTPPEDTAVDHDDFACRRHEFEDLIWPKLVERIPRFEAIGVKHAWAGHYAFNTLDHNAVVGPSDAVANFLFANGFSGHGLQHSPGVARAISEMITYGEYRTLDLSELNYERIVRGEPFIETAII